MLRGALVATATVALSSAALSTATTALSTATVALNISFYDNKFIS